MCERKGANLVSSRWTFFEAMDLDGLFLEVEVLDLESYYFCNAEACVCHQKGDEFVFFVEGLEEEVELLWGEDVSGGFHLGVVLLGMIVGRDLSG